MPVVQGGVFGWRFEHQRAQAALDPVVGRQTSRARFRLPRAFVGDASSQALQPGTFERSHGRAATQVEQQRGLRDHVFGNVRACPLERLQTLGHLGKKLARFGLLVGSVALQLLLHLPQRQQQRARGTHTQRGADSGGAGVTTPQRLGLGRIDDILARVQACRDPDAVAGRCAPTWQLGHPAFVHGAAEVFAEPVIALPLGFVERLVAGGFVRKTWMFFGIGQYIQIQCVVQVGLDHQQRAFGPERLAWGAIGFIRPWPLTVPDTRHQNAPARMVVGHVFR